MTFKYTYIRTRFTVKYSLRPGVALQQLQRCAHVYCVPYKETRRERTTKAVFVGKWGSWSWGVRK